MKELPEPEGNQTDQIQDKLLVEWALKKLPEEFREVVILHYLQDMKLKDVANTLQIGLPLVKYRMKAAKQRLEQIFREEKPV